MSNLMFSVVWSSETPYLKWCLKALRNHFNPDWGISRTRHESFSHLPAMSLVFLMNLAWLELFLTLPQPLDLIFCSTRFLWGRSHGHWQAIYHLSYQVCFSRPKRSEFAWCWQNTNIHHAHHSMCQVALCIDSSNCMRHCLTLSFRKVQFHLNFCERHFHQFQNLKKKDREKSQETSLLTILLVLWLSQCNEFRKTLVLIPGHGSITTTLEGEIKIKMLVQVLLHGLVSHKSHAADGTVVL